MVITSRLSEWSATSFAEFLKGRKLERKLNLVHQRQIAI
jgi:hypothetical protein